MTTMFTRPARRTMFACALALTLAVGCKKSEPRCERCGMKLDPQSAWNAELVLPSGETKKYDTPRCALQARTGLEGAVRVQEFYGKAWSDGKQVRFVPGSDVLGPMGPDIVPVDPARAGKFVADHGGGPALPLEAVTPAVIDGLK